MLNLRAQSPTAWLTCVMADFDAFLLDHATCEKKAHSSALTLVSHYPDRRELVQSMIELAQEELEHYRQVWEIIDSRGLKLGADKRDPYIRSLLRCVRNGRDTYLMDRLLIFGIVEARGCERFGLIANALEPGPLKTFYEEITRSEARHHGLFVRLANTYFDKNVVSERLDALLDQEAQLIGEIPICAALH